MDTSPQLIDAISTALGEPVQITGSGYAGGGSINRTVALQTSAGPFFVKFNQASLLDMFEAERAGLTALGNTNSLRVPNVITCGADLHQAWLVLEYLSLGQAGRQGMASAGEALAALHRHSQDKFGWHRDNTIGSTPQHNHQHSDWIRFWQQERLGFQLRLAEQNGYHGDVIRLGEKLLSDCAPLLDHDPLPSLLHGDLWSGNLAFDEQQQPVTYDPAVYYGDREADLAMTELFGGFSSDFYAAYGNCWPLDSGYPVRRKFYNLYHILNHMNLFGGGYQSQATNMTRQLLAEIE